MDEVGTEQSSDADSDLFGLDWDDEPDVSINSVVGQKDQAQLGRELVAFVDFGAVDNVLPRTLHNEYHLEKAAGEGANGSHIKLHGQRRSRVKTSAGSNVHTTREVADVRKPLISASRLLERRHKLVLDEKPRIQCKNGDVIALERCGRLFAVRLRISRNFLQKG